MACPNCRSFKRGPHLDIDLRASYSYRHLLKSAETCACCDILIRGCRGLLDALGKRESDVKSWDIWLAYEPNEDSDVRDCEKLIKLQLNTGETINVVFCILQDENGETEVPDSWDDMPTGRRTSGGTASDGAFECMKDWIHECSTEHEFCSRLDARPLPTRLVDVGLADGKVRLTEANGKSGSYVALSHCWGKEQIITTTKATLLRRKEGVRFEECSETFYQAIQLTRRLEMDYIWIDSLCIVQDDKEDWAREASKMASFYENAALTIAATSSSSGNGGLYRLKPDFVLSGITAYDGPYQLIFRERIDHETMNSADEHLRKAFPLMDRAWVLQERLLSSRVIHFGPHELFFECKTSVECECGEIEGYEVANANPKLMYAEALSSSDNDWYLVRAWHGLIGLYTGLSLSHSSDILPTFGGLARQMSTIRSSKYFAGLWSDSILEDMIWRGGPGNVRPDWRAPTWSWASIRSPVYYSDGPLYWNPDEAQEERPPYEHFATVLGFEVKPKFQDEFGEVESGELRLRSRCGKATLQYWDPDGKQGLSIPGAIRPAKGQKSMMYAVQMLDGSAYQVFPDYALEEPSRDFVPIGTEVFCVLISLVSVNSTDRAPRNLYALVLLRNEADEAIYERIALLVVDERRGRDVEAAINSCTEVKDLTLI